MINPDRGIEARKETIRTTDWAAQLHLGSCQRPVDDGLCADLDRDRGDDQRIASPSFLFGLERGARGGTPTIASEILDVVRSVMPQAEIVGVRFRIEIDLSVGGLTAGPLATVLFGMLRRAVDAYALAQADGESFADAAEVAICARLDGMLVRLHVLDGANRRLVPSADAAIGLSAATAESLGGTLEICTVPFGQETLLSATIPASRLAYTNENAA